YARISASMNPKDTDRAQLPGRPGREENRFGPATKYGVCLPARLVAHLQENGHPFERPASIHADLPSHQLHALHHIAQLLLCGPTRRLAQAAIRRKGQLFRRRELQAPAHAFGNITGRLEVIALYIDDPDSDIVPPA